MSLSPLYPDLTSDLHVSTAFERPSRFPLTSFGPGKARYLSGPSECALLQILFTYDRDRALLILTVTCKGVSPAISQVLTFIARRMVSITQTLAHSVDSLVRVSRRLVKDRVTPSRKRKFANVKQRTCHATPQTDSIVISRAERPPPVGSDSRDAVTGPETPRATRL